jgi:hypothetical protein
MKKAADEGASALVQRLYQHACGEPALFDAAVTNTALHAAAAAGDSVLFASVWADMDARNVPATAASHVCKAALLGRAAGAAAVADYIADLTATSPELLSPHLFAVTFAASQRGHCVAGGELSFAELRALWGKMRAARIEPNNHLLSAFFSACREDLEPRQVEICFSMLNDFRSAHQRPQV